MTIQRRTGGVIAAVVLAVLGTLGLVAYVNGAKDRAVAGEKRVAVYVTTKKIAAGTPANQLTKTVKREEVPVKVRASDAVTNLKDLSGSVTSVDLVAGEQLVKSRFLSLGAIGAKLQSSTDTPDGLFTSTVSLEPEQALGGQIRAGQRVAVVALDTHATEPGPAALIARDVVVTSVQIDGDRGEGAQKKEVTDAPTGKFFVTLALTQIDLEKLVAAVNDGKVWLASEVAAR
jgi:pilus assembly protein CpaB